MGGAQGLVVSRVALGAAAEERYEMSKAEMQSPRRATRPRQAEPALRASALFALRVYNSHILEGLLEEHIRAVMHARTEEQIREVIALADGLLRR